jgi:hypothetical protein
MYVCMCLGMYIYMSGGFGGLFIGYINTEYSGLVSDTPSFERSQSCIYIYIYIYINVMSFCVRDVICARACMHSYVINTQRELAHTYTYTYTTRTHSHTPTVGKCTSARLTTTTSKSNITFTPSTKRCSASSKSTIRMLVLVELS